jgi:hypothetical protein
VIALSQRLVLATHNTQKRQTSLFASGFEPTIAASEQPQTNASDGVDNGKDTLNVNAAILSEVLAPIHRGNFSNYLNLHQLHCGKFQPRAGFLLRHKIPLYPSLIPERYQALFQG